MSEGRPFQEAKPKATPIEELAEALPPGRDEKGKCTSVTAGDLTSMLSVVMNRQQGFIRWNLMSQEGEVNGSPLSDHQQECIYIPIQQRGYLARKSDAKDALAMAAQADAYHPVRDYLDSVRSGPKVDITRLASFYLRPADLESSPDEPTIYDRMLFKTLVGAVKRAYEPGCLFDTCTVLKALCIEDDPLARSLANTSPSSEVESAIKTHCSPCTPTGD